MSKKQKEPSRRYGLGEWFGHVVANQQPQQLNALAKKAKLSVKDADMPCPFRQAVQTDAKCNKKGGVCSLQSYARADNGVGKPGGPFITTCPYRFWQDNNVFRWVGETVIETAKPTLIREVRFLDAITNAGADELSDSPQAHEEIDADGEEKDSKDSVGRIDMILVDSENTSHWCALELQAVYFSGKGMSSHLKEYEAADIKGPVFPDANRRPDFRSSGPKRLMPQLQTKVPTLRRWGKKMAVVVDRPFYNSLGKIVPVPHLSNADIAWFVVDYDPSSGAINLLKTVFSTLENSVEALTSGIPNSKEFFEQELHEIRASEKPSMKKKVFRIS